MKTKLDQEKVKELKQRYTASYKALCDAARSERKVRKQLGRQALKVTCAKHGIPMTRAKDHPKVMQDAQFLYSMMLYQCAKRV